MFDKTYLQGIINKYAVRDASGKINKKATIEKITAASVAGEINVYAGIMAVLLLVVGYSLIAMFNAIFPAVTGQVIANMAVNSTNNVMYPIVSAVPANAQSWFGLNSTVATILGVAVLASLALSIFIFGRR